MKTKEEIKSELNRCIYEKSQEMNKGIRYDLTLKIQFLRWVLRDGD